MMGMKSKGTAYILWLFLGLFGAHRFYLNKVGTGILYFFTVGLFGVGWLYDLFTLGGQVDMYNLMQANLMGGARNNNENTNNIVVNIPSQGLAPEKSSAEKLLELSDLKEKGVITQEEFDDEKKKILGSNIAPT